MRRIRFMNLLIIAALIFTMGVFGVAQTAAAVEDDDDGGQTTLSFTDVPEYHPAKEQIEYCVKNEFMFGYGDGTFKPDGDITREHFVTVWARTFHARMHNFNDATKTRDEIDNAIVLMYGFGYVNGMSETEFARNAKITREQVAQIVKNTYLKGVDGHDMYTAYDDAAQVSGWARDAVSVVRDKGIFGDITKNNKFEPQKAMTRAEVCMLIYNLMEVHAVKYSITVTPSANGTVTPNKSTAAAGETVKLIIAAEPGYKLTDGSLKINGTELTGTSFIMPAENVTITAAFEEIPVLESIEIKTPPKTSYNAGDTLDIKGLVITATYSVGESKDISTGLTTTPPAGTVLTTDDAGDVTVSYTEGSVTKETTYAITVEEAPGA